MKKMMRVKKKDFSNRELERLYTIGLQSGKYFYIDQVRHMGMCWVKSRDGPIKTKLNTSEVCFMETNEFIKKMRENARAKRKVLPVIQ